MPVWTAGNATERNKKKKEKEKRVTFATEFISWLSCGNVGGRFVRKKSTSWNQWGSKCFCISSKVAASYGTMNSSG